MSILNYTTTIDHAKTVGEICGMLAKAKARAVLTEYDGFGTVEAVSFKIDTEHGIMAFRLPANTQRVLQVMLRDRGIPRRARCKEQAARVAWRILKDWLAVQLALIQCGMVDVTQVFLPYMQMPDGTTVYENMKERKFAGLCLTNGSA